MITTIIIVTVAIELRQSCTVHRLVSSSCYLSSVVKYELDRRSPFLSHPLKKTHGGATRGGAHRRGHCAEQRDKLVPPRSSGMIITIAIIVAVTSTAITQTR